MHKTITEDEFKNQNNCILVTLSALQTKTNSYAYSVDPDQTAHMDLHCLLFGSRL